MNIPERMKEKSLTAEEFLDKQNYTKEVKLPNGSKVEPSFGRTTVTRLMKEFAEEAVADACKKQREICARVYEPNYNDYQAKNDEVLSAILSAPQPPFEEEG